MTFCFSLLAFRLPRSLLQATVLLLFVLFFLERDDAMSSPRKTRGVKLQWPAQSIHVRTICDACPRGSRLQEAYLVWMRIVRTFDQTCPGLH